VVAPPLPKCLQHPVDSHILRYRLEKPDPVDPPRLLLPLADERYCEDAEADGADERASVHYSITWSASASTECGIVRPSALMWSALQHQESDAAIIIFHDAFMV
jgi:hypothetical protein